MSLENLVERVIRRNSAQLELWSLDYAESHGSPSELLNEELKEFIEKTKALLSSGISSGHQIMGVTATYAETRIHKKIIDDIFLKIFIPTPSGGTKILFIDIENFFCKLNNELKLLKNRILVNPEKTSSTVLIAPTFKPASIPPKPSPHKATSQKGISGTKSISSKLLAKRRYRLEKIKSRKTSKKSNMQEPLKVTGTRNRERKKIIFRNQ